MVTGEGGYGGKEGMVTGEGVRAQVGGVWRQGGYGHR